MPTSRSGDIIKEELIRMRKRNLVLAGVGIFVGIGALGSLGGSPTTTPTTSPNGNASVEATQTVEATQSVAEATPATAADGDVLVAKGEPVDVGDATVTILDAKYADKVGQFQEPADGYVYFALKVRYEATDGETLVNSGDWNVLADGTKQGQWAIVVNDAWDPALTFDTLTTGATTEGWITFEVPKPTDNFRVQFDNDMFNDEPQFVSDFAVA